MISNLLLQRRYLGNCSKRTRQDGKRLVGRPLRQFTTSSSVPLHKKKKQNKAKLKGNRIKLCIHFWRICRQVFTIMHRKRSKTVCPVFFFFFGMMKIEICTEPVLRSFNFIRSRKAFGYTSSSIQTCTCYFCAQSERSSLSPKMMEAICNVLHKYCSTNGSFH